MNDKKQPTNNNRHKKKAFIQTVRLRNNCQQYVVDNSFLKYFIGAQTPVKCN